MSDTGEAVAARLLVGEVAWRREALFSLGNLLADLCRQYPNLSATDLLAGVDLAVTIVDQMKSGNLERATPPGFYVCTLPAKYNQIKKAT
jgi:hypothetical protein